MMTSLLTWSTAHHDALRQVQQGDVVFHTLDHPGGTGGFCRAGAGSGRIPIDLFVALSTLWRSAAIEILPPRGLRDRVDHVRAVALTSDGTALLSEWGAWAA